MEGNMDVTYKYMRIIYLQKRFKENHFNIAKNEKMYISFIRRKEITFE